MLALFCDASQPPKTVRGTSIGDYVDWNCFSLPDCRRREQLWRDVGASSAFGAGSVDNFLEVGVGVLWHPNIVNFGVL